MRRPLLLLVLLALTATSCRSSDLEVTGESVPGGGMPSDGDAGPDITAPAVTDPDDVVDLALRDLETFWEREMPDTFGIAHEALGGGFVPYGPGSDIPPCGEALTYDDVAENALYCPVNDYIAWDRVNLIPPLQEQFGPLTIGIVMAHEYGHAIQARADVEGSTVTLELQADCLAGAWVADAEDRLPTFTTRDGAFDLALAGLLQLRDTLGVTANDPNAHGSGFDRVSAFQDGYEHQTGACADYEEDPPPVVAIPFGSRADLQAGGNLPIVQLLGPLVADLESFFRAVVTELGGEWDPVDDIVPVDPATDVVQCGSEEFAGEILELAAFYCVPTDMIYIDDTELVPALAEIGDFAFGGEIARQYAFAAQTRLGLSGSDRAEGLHADCLAGVYSSAEFLQEIPDQQLQLSPGDLDEILIAFLAFGGGVDATAFERIAIFRAGFLDGLDACDILG